jgi:hypothetical protein
MAFCLELCMWPDVISDSRLEAALCQCLQGASSDCLRRCKFLVQSNILPNGKVQTHEDQKRRDKWRPKSRLCPSFSMASRNYHNIRPGRPNSQFRILLCCFTVTAWKCAKTSLWTLATKELVASQQCNVSYFIFHQGIYDQKQHDCHPPHPTSQNVQNLIFYL